MNHVNYLRLRADLVGLLATPEKFHHGRAYHRYKDAPVCVACRAKMLETGLANIGPDLAIEDFPDIGFLRGFLVVSLNEATALYRPRIGPVDAAFGEPFLRDAIAHLDEIAVRHGLSVPTEDETPPMIQREHAFLETLRQEYIALTPAPAGAVISSRCRTGLA